MEESEIRLHLLTLIANHFHLALETRQGNLSCLMHSLTTAETVSFDRRHQGPGHLLGGRIKAKVVEGEDYLLRLSRYVHPRSGLHQSDETETVARTNRLLESLLLEQLRMHREKE